MGYFMGYQMGGLATDQEDLFGYEIVDQARSPESLNGDDIALLHGMGGAAEFINGEIRAHSEGTEYSLRNENDYIVCNGRWYEVVDGDA
jgi:hypothetical protein